MALRRLMIALGLAAGALLSTPPAASADLPAVPCGGAGLLCGQIRVPLDRSAAAAGDLPLSFVRLPAGAAPAGEAVVALAGGPGQAAVPLASSFAEELEPLRRGRDLLVFDQRGTGSSGSLSCSVFGWPRRAESVEPCARQLGQARGSYRSIDSAQDVESLRVAGGYERLVLYGVSYGTKVALTYAARYPERVASLVLDSVVPVDGPDPFARPAFAATGRVLRELCGAGACDKATRDVTGDLRRAVRRLERGALHGSVTSPRGRRIGVRIDAAALWGVLLAGDLNPALRAELPGALRAMLRGDRTPILRLAARAEGLSGTARRPTLPPGIERQGLQSAEFNETLFATTRCEETPFPWDRAVGSRTRLAQLRDAVGRLPSGPFSPFGRGVALEAGLFDLCLRWPVASPAPTPVGGLPNVPTLVLNGATDLRTSVEQARDAVSTIPGARIAAIARTGHSVLSSDLSGCAARELEAFATSTSAACPPIENLFRPTPAPPASLAAVRGRTKTRRTIAAVVATLDDVRRQLIGDAIAAQRPVTRGSRTGGLRGGVAVVEGSFATLSNVSYVPGVRVSGSYAFREGVTHVRVRGSSAARGELAIDQEDRVSGTLDGRAVSVDASAAAAVAERGHWPEPTFPHPDLRLPWMADSRPPAGI